MWKKLLITSLLLFLLSSVTRAQGVFSTDSTKFLKDITNYLGQVNKQDAKEFQKEFEPIWFGGVYTPAERALIYSAANQIALKKLKIYPDFKEYLISIKSAKEGGMTAADFEQWHETVEKALNEKNRKRFTSYINTCALLLSDNIIFQSSSTTWKSSNKNYKFTYDKEPEVHFEEIELKCYAKNDSSVLFKTKGVYFPYSSKWEGTGGTLTWRRAELPEDKFYAEIGEYDISMKSAGYSVDSAKFYSTYFEEPIYGELREKVLSYRGIDQVSYPKFVSYSKRLSIEDIFPNVDFNGGFQMEGADLLGAGTVEDLSRLEFSYKDKPFATAEALVFVINPKGAVAERAKVKFLIEEDSITHPGVFFQFSNKNDEAKITLTRGKGITIAPYTNTYHKLDMYSEALYWKMGDPIITFGPLFGSTDSTAKFTSTGFFSPSTYDKFTGDGLNPLVLLKTKSDELGRNDLTLLEASAGLKTSKDYAEVQLYELMVEGFLEYNKELGTVILKEKLFNYIKQRVGRMDFDVIDITSNSNTNAELSLVSNDLKVNGVNKFTLSQRQFVRVYPENQEVIIKKNRDMRFAGIINAGRTEYFGSQFYFEYDNFKINLIECDSLRLRAVNRDRTGPPQIRLGSKLEGISGNILIDDAANKSGKDTSFHRYPILNVNKKTYVYYDDNAIQNGAYNRDNFKFVVEPFELDSLDNFSNSGLAFDGEFISAGIFPNMKETLKIQDDYSLGFVRKAEKGGVGIYGEKANYENEIRLSNKGLQGSGEIDFLSSHAESTAITFFPDSLNAIAEVYHNEPSEEDPQVPLVNGSNVYVSYIPDNKVLFAGSHGGNELKMYGDTISSFDGRLALRPEGMTGSGYMYIENGQLLSNLYKFKYEHLDADTAEFFLRTVNLEEMAFKTENVNAHVSFKTRKGQFKSNSGESFVQFPENQYICYMDQFNWLMDQDDLEMESKEKGNVNIETDLDLAGSNFYSVHPKQDSLSFKSPKAKFDVRKKIITCERVEYIETADARVFPDSGMVTIKKKAKMMPFKKAKILANYVTKYHNIFDADVEIFGKKDYEASGFYNYVDESENQQKFYFSNIKPDTAMQTTAKGAVTEDANFQLSPQFDYVGDIEMFASYKELTFKGEVRLSAHTCAGIERNWMSFEAAIDPKDIFIPVSQEMFDSKGNPVGAGLVLNTDSIGLYSTFLSNKKDKDHIDVMSASGFLKYDKGAKEYRISTRDKLIERSLPGNYVSLGTEDCKMVGDGRFDFGCEFGLLEISPVGVMEYDPNTSQLDMKASMKISFPFNDGALGKMEKQISDFPELPPLDFNNSTYEKSLREVMGLTEADKIISDLNIYGKIKGKLPDELVTQLYLADVQLSWDKDRNAYVSKGKIGLANVGKDQIFKQLDGQIAIYKRPTGDEISILLKLDDDNYYFFNYKRGLFQTYSTNEDYNNVILETKKDKTKFNAPKGKEDFQFMLGTKTKAIAFMRDFE
ncbi:hypothetical protein [Parvicella tangerina]|uniref:Uncharacterized protein n=1 Tax=Parvicella tangerina TaxID=2829795 RepID=A0A916JP89_9FLAO|nr:hypothetical protein [Parvicella tangerina]CAG5084451.1 hypothetical protein CRYO30217_02468 [Parvicella tangerina]